MKIPEVNHLKDYSCNPPQLSAVRFVLSNEAVKHGPPVLPLQNIKAEIQTVLNVDADAKRHLVKLYFDVAAYTFFTDSTIHGYRFHATSDVFLESVDSADVEEWAKTMMIYTCSPYIVQVHDVMARANNIWNTQLYGKDISLITELSYNERDASVVVGGLGLRSGVLN